MTTAGEAPRNAGIDLLRALSVALVVLSHYRVIPPDFPIGGYHGVIVFFAVSGYCMAMTAPTKTFWSFWRARWRSLVPLFLVCALVTYAVEAIYPWDRGQTVTDLALTLICIPTFDIPCEAANAIAQLFGRRLQYSFVDGAYWSLLVEFRFYLVFAILYFAIGSLLPVLKRWTWAILLVLSLGALFNPSFGQGRAADFLQYLPFFAFGLAAFQVKAGDRYGWYGMALSVATLMVFATVQIKVISIPFDWQSVLIYAALLAGFFVALRWRASAHTITWRAVTWLAGISYPLYLLHQDIGLWLIQRLIPMIGPALATLAVMVLVALLASVLAPIRDVGQRRTATVSHSAGAQ